MGGETVKKKSRRRHVKENSWEEGDAVCWREEETFTYRNLLF
jgi:hypothetical protein